MVPSEDLIVKEEAKEVKCSKSNTTSPLHGSRRPQDRSTDVSEIERNKRYALLSSSTFRKLGNAPSVRFWEYAQGRDDASRAVPSSSVRLRERLSGLAHKISWDSLKVKAIEWFKDPMNLALLVWISVVVVSGEILFLVTTGMLNGALPKDSQRNAWLDVLNQILNAAFTLMCLYQHPQRFLHLVMLVRWKPEDISALRKVYCKNGTYKPHEWAHMLVVVLLLHLNCFAQYALCGLNVGYKRLERPPIAVAVTISVAIASSAIAGVYTIVSPLGKDYDFPADEEAQAHMTVSIERRKSFMVREDGKIVECQPKWNGEILDFWEDTSMVYLSLFCSCCVFGWNMERLGFGNMYVHVATFVLFCTAPFYILNLAGLNLNNETARQALGISGLLLCVFGLLYGGYWRIRMRKRFNLPAYTSCCGKPAVSDCFLWLCCCWCSLAQEVRTANFYDIVDDKLYRKNQDENVELRNSQSPSEENGISNNHLNASASHISLSESSVTATAYPGSGRTEENVTREGVGRTMTPPSPLSINREGE